MVFKFSTKLILLVFILLGIADVAVAQSNFSVSRITPDDGLSQGSNYFRYEDSKGFMWITCNDAVNRFDGKMVKVYNLNKYFKNCPALQQGYGLAEDAASNIYIGSTRGLYIYNRQQDKFTLQKIFTTTADEVAMPIACIAGKVWCFNRFYQLASYDVTTHQVTMEGQAKQFKPLSSVHIYQLAGNVFYFHYPFIDNQKNIWLTSDDDVACYNLATKTITYPLSDFFKSKSNSIHSTCFCAALNTIFIGTEKGILKFNLFTQKKDFFTQIEGKPTGIVVDVLATSTMIIFKSEQGLFFTDIDLKKIIWEEESSTNSYIRCNQFTYDKSGRLWMNDDGKGQVIFNFKPRLLPKIPDNNSTLSYFKIAGVSILAELPDGNVLVQGKMVFNPQTKTVTPFLNNLSSALLFRTTTDWLRNGVWLYDEILNATTLSKQILFFDGKQILPIITTNDNTNDRQQDLAVLPDGSLMVSQSSGLYWINLVTKKLEKINEVTQPSAFKINVLSQNQVAVSFLNNDMLLLQIAADKKVTVLKKILPGVQSFYMQHDTVRHQYWVGSNEGVYLLDKNFSLVKKIDANNGLAGTYIYGLLLDNDGNVWCSHQHGLSSVNATTFQIINYDKADGIQDWDFNNRAFCKAKDGTLYFGGTNGFNYFKPPLKTVLFYKPEVYVDEILVNDKTYLPDSNANYIHELKLSFSQNNIAIKAIIKDLENAANRQLIYRIIETDSRWKYLPNNSTIAFNSLAPGTYTLALGTYDKYTNTELQQKTITIIIASPFYQRIWFWVLLGVAFSAIVFWFYNRRNLNQQKIKFEQRLALEKQRSKITADLHDDIGASLSSLQVNSMVANQLINKDIEKAKLVLDKIESQSKNIAEKIGDIIWSMKPGKEEFMTLSSRIKNFASDMLGATDIVYNINIDKEIDTRLQDITTRKNVVLIAKEAINNAAKYSQATTITIELKIIENKITLSVKDNGIGFSTTKTMGNGIQNMQRRVEELHGEFSITSAEKEGTTILVMLPLVPKFNDNK